MSRRLVRLSVVWVLLVASAAASFAQEKANKAQFPGETAEGFLLPNGWRVTPVGDQVPLTDLPFNIVVTPDSQRAIVTTNGYNAHEISLIDLKTKKPITKATVPQSWFGVAVDAKAERLWWSGGGENQIHSFAVSASELKAGMAHKPAKPAEGEKASEPEGFRTGLCLDASSKPMLYSLTILAKGGNKSFAWGDAMSDAGLGGVLTAIDLSGEKPPRSNACGIRPYDVVKARNGLLYVSDWAARRVLIVDPQFVRTIGRIPVGEHPNQMVLHPKDNRLFVACASSNNVSVIDTTAGTVQETIFTALFPQSPEGSTPTALAIAPNGKTLYVANSDNNCVAVIDVSKPRQSQVKGFIPTGWYPTAVAVTPDGEQLLVGVGKGNQTKSNRPADEVIATARKKKPGEGDHYRIPFPHIGTTLSGALAIIELPEEEEDDDDDDDKPDVPEQLAKWTDRG